MKAPGICIQKRNDARRLWPRELSDVPAIQEDWQIESFPQSIRVCLFSCYAHLEDGMFFKRNSIKFLITSAYFIQLKFNRCFGLGRPTFVECKILLATHKHES